MPRRIFRLLSLILFLFFAVLTLLVILSGMETGGACSCPASGYMPGSAVIEFIRARTELQSECSPVAGCTFSFFVVPVDLIFFALVFLTLYFKIKKRV